MAKSCEDLTAEMAALKVRERELSLAIAAHEKDWLALVGAASMALIRKDRISPAILADHLGATLAAGQKAQHRNQLAALQAMGGPPMAGQ
jgi:hypothetical protein